MVLKVFNTLTRKKEVFKPLKNKKVKMFVCGQTVYDDAHLGHAKTYIQFDIIVRWLRHEGYRVFYVQNITDVDDKIIKRANERGMSPFELANFYTKRFFEDMEALGVKQNVDMFPKSTDYIPQMIEQIKTLIEKGYAYVVDGNVYYDVTKFEDYTKLSGMKIEDLEKHRIEPDPRKKNPFDFSLWKGAKEGEPSWDSPWGRGRPGWHIEDTAMTVTIFGPQYDIHGGANELIFPHHTNEIAQAEAATGVKPFVKYWLHSGVLNVKGEKMSKSLKNFITIREFLESHNPEVLRLYYAMRHYRSEMELDEDEIKKVEKKLEYLYETMKSLKNSVTEEKKYDERLNQFVMQIKKKFREAMNDDFNTPLALSHVFTLTKKINQAIEKEKLNKRNVDEIIKALKDFGSVFGILEKKIEEGGMLPEEVRNLIIRRTTLRKMGDFKAADEVRERILKDFGILIEDTKEGIRWKKVNK
jgi:cysteinyl-tRNA synthetase